jgi:hypothetical protein
MSMNTSGQQIDYETFKSEFDSNPAYQNIVDRFDSAGITVKTKTKDNQPRQGNGSGGSSVDSMAKRAAANTLKR